MKGARPLLAALVLATTACGDEGGRAPGPTPPPPYASDERVSRISASTRLRAALDREDLDDARAALEVLRRDHEGRGEMPDGRALSPEAMSGAVFDAAVAAARRRMSGPSPDRVHAEAALALAQSLAPDLDDSEAARSWTAAARWLSVERLADLSLALAPHDGPRVVLAADDFDLGEPDLLRTLSRWAREGVGAGLRVGLVPLYRGYVRVGTRRTRARDRDEERAAVAERLKDTGVLLEPEPAQAAAASADLGLLGQDAALLVADRAGRIVARLSGRALDLASLAGAVQRVGSR